MREQIHGGDIYRNQNVLDFSVNSNPLGPPIQVLKTIREQADQIVHYPDIQCSALSKAIAKFEHVQEEEIVCGNGAAELFFAAVLAVMPRKALLLAPTFAEYEKALKAVGTEIQYYELQKSQEFQVTEEILDQITSQMDMFFVCNPNNPTGQPIQQELLEKILNRCQECDVWVVLDECFIDFLDHPEFFEMCSKRQNYSKLLIVKAFTKLFCMPGLRLGYGISCNQELLGRMAEVLQPWNVSILAQMGGVAALDDCAQYIQDTREYISVERDAMIQEMKMLGYSIYGSKANYIFFSGKPGLYAQALNAGFLIRDCKNYRGLSEGYYRIAVRTKDENERMIAWLRQL